MGMTGQDPGEKAVLHLVPLWGRGKEGRVNGFDKAARTLFCKGRASFQLTQTPSTAPIHAPDQSTRKAGADKVWVRVLVIKFPKYEALF